MIILGSGRSGTSMVAGALFGEDFYMGTDLYPGTISNPKGYFESWGIVSINEDLLAQVVPPRPPVLGKWFFHDRPILEQRWLARIPVETTIPCSDEIRERIKRVVQKNPFCFKDGRFSYTLPVWRPFLENVVFICVFRGPAIVVTSILKNCKDEPSLRNFSMNSKRAMEVWCLINRHILEIHRHESDWLFIHYNQVLTQDGLDRIEKFVGTKINRDFPAPSLNRSKPIYPVPIETQRIYEQLCALAGYSENRINNDQVG